MTGAAHVEELARALPRHEHDHPPVRDLNTDSDRRMGAFERLSAPIAAALTSPAGAAVQAVLLVAWLATFFLAPRVAPLLGLVAGVDALLAVITALTVLRTLARRDRLRARNEYETAARGEEEMRAVMAHLEAQDEFLIQILVRLDRAERELRRLTRSQEP